MATAEFSWSFFLRRAVSVRPVFLHQGTQLRQDPGLLGIGDQIVLFLRIAGHVIQLVRGHGTVAVAPFDIALAVAAHGVPEFVTAEKDLKRGFWMVEVWHKAAALQVCRFLNAGKFTQGRIHVRGTKLRMCSLPVLGGCMPLMMAVRTGALDQVH